MAQRMTQYKGIDTKVEQFQPSRANPVASRRVRSYYAQQPLAGTSIFENLTFQIEQTNPKNVINSMRMVFPLELRAIMYDNDTGAHVSMPMHTNSWTRASNIAVGQNAPFSAFRDLNIAINGKVYSEQFQRYGKTLGQCFQSYSELQFQNDESLKPIANNFKGTRRDAQVHQILNPDGSHRRNIRVVDFDPAPQTFSLLENNSGFLARARRFQEQLQEGGKVWRGDISSLFNASLFNAEARRSGNDQIPYVQSLYVNAVFDSNESSFDTKYQRIGSEDMEGYERTIPQKLFEFLTQVNSGFPYEEMFDPVRQFPLFYTLKWTAQPRIDIEWVTYSQALLAPAYKLRGLRYQHEETLPFQIPWAGEVENRNWVTASMQRQILAVPNLIYIWVSQTRSSGRDMFGNGGVFRTCDIKKNSLKVRVNGAVDIIQGPSNELLYKWYKRNTASVFEFPTWEKNKVIVISPSEVGLSEWLANQASVSTLDISLETSYSTLQLPEIKHLTTYDNLMRSLYENVGERNSVRTITDRLNITNIADDGYNFYIESDMFAGDPKICQGDETLFYISTGAQYKDVMVPWNNEGSYEPTASKLSTTPLGWKTAFGNNSYQFTSDSNAGEFRIKDVKQVFTSWRFGMTYWIKVNIENKDVETDDNGYVVIWATDETHIFEKKGVGRFNEIRWEMFLQTDNLTDRHNDPEIIAAGFCGENFQDDSLVIKFWEQAAASVQSFDCKVHMVHKERAIVGDAVSGSDSDDEDEVIVEADDTYAQSLSRRAAYHLNYEDTKASTVDSKFIFNDGGEFSDTQWSIAPNAALFRLSNQEGWSYEDDSQAFYEEKEDPNMDESRPAIDRDHMAAGWRWAKMADPMNQYAYGDFNALKPFIYKDDDFQDVLGRPTQYVTCRCEVERGVNGFDSNDVSFGLDATRADRELQRWDDQENVMDAVNSFEHSLNVLLEYNNETVLMTQERGKPVHFPNLMLAQGRAPLPSQEDAYLQS